MPVIPESKVRIVQRVDGLKTLIHGAAGQVAAGSWLALDFVLPVTVHIQKVRIKWVGAKPGDYGFLVVVHPSGNASPAQAVAEGATQVVLPSAELAAVYAAALAVEFWSADGATLVERHQVESVDGATVTLKTATTTAHGTDANLKALLDTYSPCLGGTNVTAGYRMLDTDHDEISSESEITPAIPAGIVIGTRFRTSDEAGTRLLSVNYRFRLCDGSCSA